MSVFVVIALVADGSIQLFAPAQIASLLQQTGFAMDLTRVVGPTILACAILYSIPLTAVLGAIHGDGLFWEVPSAPMSALVSWGRRRKSLPCFWARPECAREKETGFARKNVAWSVTRLRA